MRLTQTFRDFHDQIYNTMWSLLSVGIIESSLSQKKNIRSDILELLFEHSCLNGLGLLFLIVKQIVLFWSVLTRYFIH